MSPICQDGHLHTFEYKLKTNWRKLFWKWATVWCLVSSRIVGFLPGFANPNKSQHCKTLQASLFLKFCWMLRHLHTFALPGNCNSTPSFHQQLKETSNAAWWPSSSNDTRIIIILSKVSPRCNFGQTSFSQPGGDTWRLHRGSFSSLSSSLYNYLKPIPNPKQYDGKKQYHGKKKTIANPNQNHGKEPECVLLPMVLFRLK